MALSPSEDELSFGVKCKTRRAEPKRVLKLASSRHSRQDQPFGLILISNSASILRDEYLASRANSWSRMASMDAKLFGKMLSNTRTEASRACSLFMPVLAQVGSCAVRNREQLPSGLVGVDNQLHFIPPF